MRHRCPDALYVLEDGSKVTPEGVDCSTGVARFECIHDIGVLLDQCGHWTGVQQAEAARSVQMGFRRCDSGPGRLVTTGPQKFAVKPFVKSEEALDVLCCLCSLLFRQDAPECREVTGVPPDDRILK